MFHITDLNTLGTEYTILDNDTEVVKTIRIIPHEEILGAAIGEYKQDEFSDYTEYLNLSLMYLEGFVEDPLTVSWYATKEEEFDIRSAVITALKEGNRIVILEILASETAIKQLKIN